MTNSADLQTPYEIYFAQFLGEHTGIASYYCAATETVIAASRSEAAFHYPLLHSELPSVSFKGNRENVVTWFQAPLFILVQPASGDTADIDDAFEKSRKIATHIIMKLFNDNINKEGCASLLEFSIDSVGMEPVRVLWGDNAVGYELNLKVGFYTSTCIDDED